MKDFSPKRNNVTRRKLYLQIRKVTAVLQLFIVLYWFTFTNVEVKQKLCNVCINHDHKNKKLLSKL